MPVTSTNLANAIVKLVAADALPALLGNLVMGNLVSRDFEPTLAQPGDKVIVPAPGGGVEITINTHAEATFQVPDVTKVIAVPDLLSLYMRPALVALSEKIDDDLMALAPQFTVNEPVATLEEAETALYCSRFPNALPKVLVVHAKDYNMLRQNPAFTEYMTASEAGLRSLIDGPVGKFKGFIVIRSHSATEGRKLSFVKEAMALAMRRMPKPLPGGCAIAEYAELGNFGVRVVMIYQPNTLAQQFTVDILYGCGILRNSYGVQVNG